ncbi:MAG: NUDIX domain-containing protein [Planctomycetes bacterium]|nr:NUDIX domain-containing protein [Planctomycetota bacterium]
MPEEPHDVKKRGSIAVIVRDGRMLVIRRSRFVVAPRTLCFPGGGIKDGESEEEALVRELQEELGVAVRPERRIWENVTPWPVHLAWWLSNLDRDAQLVPNPAEVESVHWYTPTEIACHPELLRSNHSFFHALAAGEIDLVV